MLRPMSARTQTRNPNLSNFVGAGFSPPAPPTYARVANVNSFIASRAILLLRPPINKSRNRPVQSHTILIMQVHHVPRRVVILFDILLQRIRQT